MARIRMEDVEALRPHPMGIPEIDDQAAKRQAEDRRRKAKAAATVARWTPGPNTNLRGR